MRKATIFIVLALMLTLCATPVHANGIPGLPHAFYGTVKINGPAAPNGTLISATVDVGDVLTTAQNPVATVNGNYGIDGLHLLVQGNIQNGATITFHVTNADGTATGGTATFEAGGGPTEKNLSVSIVAPPAAAPGVGAPPAAYVETTLFGIEERFRISDEGEILATITATSADGMLTITIPKGTIALDKDGDPLSSLTAYVDPSPPAPPEDAHIIGLAYEFSPAGATFDPAITFTWSYDPDDIPEDVDEEDLVLAYYDEELGEWVELPCTVDPVTNTITASVSHFTCFAIIAPPAPAPPPALAAFSVSSLSIQPAEVQPEEAVTITVSVANTGGTRGSYTVVLMVNGVKEAEKRVTIAAGKSQVVTFCCVTREEAGSYSVVVDGLSGSFTVVAPAPPIPPPPPAPPPEVKAPINWPVVGGIIAGVIVVGLLIFFLVRRRAY